MKPSEFTFSKVVTDNNNRKMVFVNSGSSKVIVATPKMWLPKGLSRIRKKDAKNDKEDSFVVDLSLQETDALFNKLTELDEVVKQQIKKNSMEWLKKAKVNDEVVDDRYKPIVNVYEPEGSDKIYHSVQLKVERENDGMDGFTGRFLSNKSSKTPLLFFDGNTKSKIPIEVNEHNFTTMVPKGCQARCLMELVYITISQRVSVKWRLIQMEVYKREGAISSYAFPQSDEYSVENNKEDLDTENVDIEEDEEDEEEKEEVVEEVESEVEAEPEPEPEPVKVVKKKRGTK
jgi:hypothetical protein